MKIIDFSLNYAYVATCIEGEDRHHLNPAGEFSGVSLDNELANLPARRP